MAKLKVLNVGPIRSGFNESNGFLEFSDVTIFIGNQGSGKSTMAKLYSTLSWIEKALVREDFTDKYVVLYNRFKKHLAYQNLGNYLNQNSFIEYVGNAFRLVFENNQFQVFPLSQNKGYHFPKIMYVPAERNFVSAIDRPDLVKRLPLPLYTFMDEYEDAKQQLDGQVQLPVGEVSFEYRKQSKKSYLIGADYHIELLEASSGFQSMVPLVLVTRHLSNVIKNRANETRKKISLEEEEKIRRAVNKMVSDETISEDVLRVLLEKLSAKYRYESFINVVEEPEQNLYPTSQKEVLFDLLKYRNGHPNNKLIITTHSPYIINFISIAIQGAYLKSKIEQSPNADQLLTKLHQIVGPDSLISGENVLIYQFEEADGSIRKLPTFDGIPSDNNLLNQMLAEGNTMFDALLEIEQEL
ncbi:MAG: AAA family ATPase [Saprospiraceae bacterium]|jgi:predicted ATPase|nr:AAA family ATPase [Saprospiraceae bacterium]